MSKQRTPQDMVEDLRELGRTDEQIKAVARISRGGAWADEVYSILGGTNRTPTPVVEAPDPAPHREPEDDVTGADEAAAEARGEARADPELAAVTFDDDDDDDDELDLDPL